MARTTVTTKLLSEIMAGDRLICVWQAIFAKATAKEENIDFAEELKDITQLLLKSQNENAFSEETFSSIVKHGYVSFQDFKSYFMDQLQNDDIPDYLQIANIEEECWKICREVYKTDLPENVLKKLWKIANRLTLAHSYPPIICKEEIELVCEKIAECINRQGKEMIFFQGDATFQVMLSYLEAEFFKNVPEEKIKECIDVLHCWLVWEVCRTGWMYKRAKTGSNWTNWVKRWTVLLPTRLLFYENECPALDDHPVSEFIISRSTTVQLLSPYQGAEIKLDGRIKLSNQPLTYCELATNDNEESKAWVKMLEQQIQSTDTPVQRLLRERYRIREELKQRINDNSKQLRKYLGTSISAQGLEFDETNDDEIEAEEEKLKAMYMKLDVDGNGFIDKKEFEKYIKELGLNMKENEINLVFNQIDKNSNGVIDFNEFCEYFSEQVLNEEGSGEDISAIRGAFMAADRDGSGKINFTEFTDYIWGKKKDIRMNNLLKAFSKIEITGDEELSFSEFRKLLEKEGGNIGKIPIDEKRGTSKISAFEKQLQKTYNTTQTDELAEFLNKRWVSFAAFRRQGSSGNLVMTGKDEMVSDILPGSYSLVDLVCYSDLPPIKPSYTVIKGVKWISSKVPGKSGRAIFPNSFEGKIATDIATNEHLRYYGACFAESQQLQVALCYRHGIQDFTYENNYLEDYAKVRGCGIETHSFAHLDCPLASKSGVFVLGKLLGDELHLTAFQVPTRHTVYVPAGTIHSNDYLIGTWRTMLSDEAVIDHVFTVRDKQDSSTGTYENFQLTFE